MKDITSLEKSKALKAAGVMPPPVEVGQVWYAREDEKFVITGVSREDIHGLYLNAGFDWYNWYNTMECFTYAFTVPDLLPMLPPDTIVQMWGGKPSVNFCTEKDGVFLEIMIEGDSLAEILADALLQTLAA